MTDKLHELNATLSELQRRKSENALQYYEPYPKQQEFHTQGEARRERLFAAGNQLGKTLAGSMEMAMHLTGLYPKWWRGRRFDGPIRAWALGTTSEATRDAPQRLLLGPTKPYGEGSIPKELIIVVSSTRGIADAADTIQVRHKSGGISTLTLKSYERGREKLQGETLDFIWCDEEPPQDIYSECLARISARKGSIIVTFTPLKGLSEVVRRFFEEEHSDRGLVRMSIEDAGHISATERKRITEGYLPHEREARTQGLPMLGEGRVYGISEEIIREPAFKLPQHWPRLVGCDFGFDHPAAAVWLAWDRDSDTVYVTDAQKASGLTISVHAAMLRSKGPGIPCAWPHDGLQHDKTSGTPIADLYRQHGVAMLKDRATFLDGGNSVEAGVADLRDRMMTGRFKVFDHCSDWFEEFRQYHRKDGRIVKTHDDLLDATRYGVMMLRMAKEVRDGKVKPRRRQVARDMDYDVFNY
jgi:phage terminase large subunit-like protein